MVTKKIFCTRKTLFNVSRQSDKLKGYFTQKCKFNLLFLIPNIYDFLSSMKKKKKKKIVHCNGKQIKLYFDHH